jgi:hypothetical protein
LPGYIDDAEGLEDEPFCDRGSASRLTPEQQQGVLRAYATAFFRTHLGDEDAFVNYLTGDLPAPPSALTDDVFPSSYAPRNQRLDVNIQDEDNFSDNSNVLGGDVTHSEGILYELCEVFGCEDLDYVGEPVHFASVHSALLKIGWDNTSTGETAWYQNDLPPGTRDLSDFDVLQFRAAVNVTDDMNVDTAFPGVSQDFSIVLTDGSGNSGRTSVSRWSGALFYPPGDKLGGDPNLPHILLNAVRIPLRAAFPRLDLSDIRSVRFVFDVEQAGSLFFSDLHLTVLPPPLPDLLEPNDDPSQATNLDFRLTRDLIGPEIFDDGIFLMRDDALVWRTSASRLSLHDLGDVDFFDFTLPDPAARYPQIVTDGGFITRTGWNPILHRETTDTILLSGRLSFVLSPLDLRLRVFHAEDTFDDIRQFQYPRTEFGMTDEVVFSLDDSIVRQYSFYVEYRIDVQRIAGSAGFFRDLFTAQELVSVLYCPGGFFPQCESPKSDPFTVDHPLRPRIERPCWADGCPDHLVFLWRGIGSLDMTFFAKEDLRYQLLDATGEFISEAIALPNQPPLEQTPLLAIETTDAVGSADGVDEEVVAKRLYIQDLPAGHYVLVVSGLASEYSIDFVPPPPAPDTDGDGIIDPFDLCPEDPEDVNGFFDTDGCPDLSVAIDIKPGSDSNAIDLFSKGLVPVALLGSDAFDLADVDVTTLAFGPDGAAPVFDLTHPLVYWLAHWDVNHDGEKDLLSYYRTEETGIALGDAQACLAGETVDGVLFEGCDDITTAGGCGLGVELLFILPPLLWLRGRRSRMLV